GLLPNPYFEWTLATNFAYYGAARWMPVLVELQDDDSRGGNTARDFAHELLALQSNEPHRQGWAADVRLPECELEALASTGNTPFIGLLVPVKFLRGVYSGVWLRGRVRRIELGRRIESPAIKPLPSPAMESWTGAQPQVVTGLIDDGIGFAHDRLFSSDGKTRIEYFWDQQVPSPTYPPAYGTEYVKRDTVDGIDIRLAQSRHGDLIDEEEVYRLSGQADHTKPGHKPLAAARSHGAHVADLACNCPEPDIPPLRPAAGTRPVIAVQLPTVSVQDTSGATLVPQIYNGLCYILHRADSIAAQSNTGLLPVVVNISYGLISGPHDGSGLLESAIDRLLADYNVPGRPAARVVLPAGNNHLSRCHARFALRARGHKELFWRVLPDDWTESSVDIWLPADADLDQLSVLVTVPDGDTGTGPFAADGHCEFGATNAPFGRATFFAAGSTTQRPRITLWLAPTSSPDGAVLTAPAGVWRIRIENLHVSAAVKHIHAWVQRDDTAPGYPRRGRQSYFDDPEYERFDDGGRAIETDSAGSYVKRRGSFNAIATGTQPIVVGGYRRSDGAAAAYSASGPLLPPQRDPPNPQGPEAMLPSDDSPSQRGVLAAGTRSNSCVALWGTSVAAPQATVGVAEWMAQNQPETRQAVSDAAQLDETILPKFLAPKPRKARGGAGRIRTPSNRRPRRED
ncbi:MAG: hypothetical protein ABIR94_20740, partial [Rubrivivax sp.]